MAKGKKHKHHPNSLKNLIHEGRPLAVGEPKKERRLTVSKTGWEGTKEVLAQLDIKSVSDLVEQIGRQQVLLVLASDQPSPEAFQGTEPS